MNMQLKYAFLVTLACSACATSPSREREPVDVPSSKLEAGPLFMMCMVLSREPQTADDVRAAAAFDQAVHEDKAGRHDAAARGFFQSAEQWRDFPYNRRVAYANGVNTWLSAGAADRARAALLQAAQKDPEFASELTAWAAALPSPANCTGPPERAP